MADREQQDLDIILHLAERIPGFRPSGTPQPLRGGLLNFVWRVEGRPESVIVKQAPPYVAAAPHVPLNPERLAMEAMALEAFQEGSRLFPLSTPEIRPPKPIDFDPTRAILIMEDVGQAPDLSIWLRAVKWDTAEERTLLVAKQIGNFIGALHSETWNDDGLSADFVNDDVQRKRFDLQYSAVGSLFRKAGIENAGDLGGTAHDVGRALLLPGRCVTMGDLWPASILMAAEGIRVIDWELSHFGNPAQDVAHLTAHLWMLAHRACRSSEMTKAFAEQFLKSYRASLGSRFHTLFGTDGLVISAVHFGAEILVRTLGTFQSGYLYDSLSVDDPAVIEAVATAVCHIRDPLRGPAFSELQ